jgi:hypothetical protein
VATNRIRSNDPINLFVLEVAVRQSVLASTTDLNVLEPLVEVGFNSIRDGDKEFYKRLTTGNDFFNDLQESTLLFSGTFTPVSLQANASFSPVPQPTAVPSFFDMRPEFNSHQTLSPSIPSIDFVLSSTPTTSVSNPSHSPVPYTSINPENQNMTKGSSQPSSQSLFTPSDYPSSTVVPSSQATFKINVPTKNAVSNSTVNPVLTAIIISAITVGTLSGICVLGIGLWFLHICTKKSSQQVNVGRESPKKKNDQKNQRSDHTETISANLNEQDKPPRTQHFIPKIMRLTKHRESLAQSTQDPQTGDGSRKNTKISVLPRRNRKVLDVDLASLDDSSIYTSLSMPIRPASQVQDEDMMNGNRKTGNSILPTRPTSQIQEVSKVNDIGSPKRDTHRNKHIPSNFDRSIDTSKSISSVSKKISKGPTIEDQLKKKIKPSRSEESDSSAILDFASTDVEDFIFGEEEGMLGAWAPISPIADRPDDWISQSMYDSGSKSGASSSKTITGITDYDSPLDLSRLNTSNIVIPDEYDLTDYIAKSNGKRYIDFDAIATRDFDSVSQSTQSSKTAQISNSISKDLHAFGTPTQFDTSAQYINLEETLENTSFNPEFRHSSQSFPTSPMPKNSFKSEAMANPIGLIAKRGDYAGSKLALNVNGKHFSSYPHKIVNPSTPIVSRKSEDQSASVFHRFGAPSNDYRISSHPTNKNGLQTKHFPTTKLHRSLSGSSSSSGGEFLYNVLERTLGPRSASADLESLSGRSHRSIEFHSSFGFPISGLRKSESSDALRQTRRSIRLENEENKDISMISPRTLFYDMQRLGQQLKVINSSSSAILSNQEAVTSSPVMSPIRTLSHSGLIPQRRVRKKTSVVVVPPGKLGIILASQRGGTGTFIAEVKNSSSLKGSVLPGDRLVAIDGVDVSAMVVAQVTSIMMEKSSKERKLTVLSSTRMNKGTIDVRTTNHK